MFRRCSVMTVKYAFRPSRPHRTFAMIVQNGLKQPQHVLRPHFRSYHFTPCEQSCAAPRMGKLTFVWLFCAPAFFCEIIKTKNWAATPSKLRKQFYKELETSGTTRKFLQRRCQDSFSITNITAISCTCRSLTKTSHLPSSSSLHHMAPTS